LYNLVRVERNSALHQGAAARRLTNHAIELSLILEGALEKLMEQRVSDFMVRDVVTASRWQPVSFVRLLMLKSSFSYIPVRLTDTDSSSWRLISDFSLAHYLRARPENSSERTVGELVDSEEIQLLTVDTVSELDPLDTIVTRVMEKPVLVLSDAKVMVGIISAFDIL
jgi:predicted transcriptional regulator